MNFAIGNLYVIKNPTLAQRKNCSTGTGFKTLQPNTHLVLLDVKTVRSFNGFNAELMVTHEYLSKEGIYILQFYQKDFNSFKEYIEEVI